LPKLPRGLFVGLKGYFGAHVTTWGKLRWLGNSHISFLPLWSGFWKRGNNFKILKRHNFREYFHGTDVAPGMVVVSCNPNTWETKRIESQVKMCHLLRRTLFPKQSWCSYVFFFLCNLITWFPSPPSLFLVFFFFFFFWFFFAVQMEPGHCAC
jgi:hypothetical protein